MIPKMFYSSSCNVCSRREYVGQHIPSVPSGFMQNRVASISDASYGTIPWTSLSSASGNHAESVSSIILKPRSLKIKYPINNIEKCHKILCINLVIATIGIHSTETSIRNTANTIHQWGHSKGSVTPLIAFHAGYLLPSDASSMKDAIKIVIMAIGDTYFQQTIQYMFGREPVISSMSSANLYRVMNKI